jgi:hypothetical protein
MNQRTLCASRPVALVCLLAASLGCGGGTSVGRVQGTVTLDSKPVSEAAVTFWPKDDPSLGAAMANTDGIGKFDVLSDPRTGTVPLKAGHYRVGVTKIVQVKGGPFLKVLEDVAVPSVSAGAGTKNLVPDKYADAKSSPVVVEIRKGDNDIPINLTAK